MNAGSDIQTEVRAPLSMGELDARLAAASPDERRAILQHLYETACETGHPDHWMLVAQGCLRVGNAEDAIEVLEQLAEQGDQARIRLANAHFRSGNFDLCTLYLRQVAEHGVTAGARANAADQLEEATEAWFGAKEGLELRALQVAALKERITTGAAGPEEFQRLAHLLLDMARLDPEQTSLPETVEVLKTGHFRFGDDVCVLEMLAQCLIRFDPEEELESVLDALRRLAPESEVFEQIDVRRHSSDQNIGALDARLERLMAMVDADSSDLRAAVLRDMHRVVAAMPWNLRYRTRYAMALGAFGESEKALAQTEILARYALESHYHHYVIANLFLKLGQTERARPHADAALRYAYDDSDIADAKNLMEQLNAAD